MANKKGIISQKSGVIEPLSTKDKMDINGSYIITNDPQGASKIKAIYWQYGNNKNLAPIYVPIDEAAYSDGFFLSGVGRIYIVGDYIIEKVDTFNEFDFYYLNGGKKKDEILPTGELEIGVWRYDDSGSITPILGDWSRVLNGVDESFIYLNKSDIASNDLTFFIDYVTVGSYIKLVESNSINERAFVKVTSILLTGDIYKFGFLQAESIDFNFTPQINENCIISNVSFGSDTSSGVSEAPNDANQYTRGQENWNVLNSNVLSVEIADGGIIDLIGLGFEMGKMMFAYYDVSYLDGSVLNQMIEIQILDLDGGINNEFWYKHEVTIVGDIDGLKLGGGFIPSGTSSLFQLGIPGHSVTQIRPTVNKINLYQVK